MLAWAGLSMQMLARGYLAYDLTGSAGLLGLITAAGALSMAALSLIGGAVADRANRKHLIQGFQAASAVLALVIALLIAVDMVAWWHLLVAAVVQGALFAFMAPARQAIIPDLVSKEQVNNAIALNAAGMSVTALLAPAIGGLVYARCGPGGRLLRRVVVGGGRAAADEQAAGLQRARRLRAAARLGDRE